MSMTRYSMVMSKIYVSKATTAELVYIKPCNGSKCDSSNVSEISNALRF